MTKSNKKPNKHHFLPVFYLRQWSGADGRLVRFTKPYGNKVKPLRVHPDGAGYIERLYAIEGLTEEAKQDLETEFLAPVDSRAADALKAMLTDKHFTHVQRLAWAGFIATLLFRMPGDIVAIKGSAAQIMESVSPGFEAIYNSLPSKYKTEPFNSFFPDIIAGNVAEVAINSARSLMGNEDIVRGLADLEWSILTTDRAKHELLTSDRPVVHSHSLSCVDSHLLVPIGPRKLFVAVKDRGLISKIHAVGHDRLVRAVNEFVVSNASVTVCGRTDSQISFIQKRMGMETQPSLLSRLPEMQKAAMAELLEFWELESKIIAQDIPRRLGDI